MRNDFTYFCLHLLFGSDNIKYHQLFKSFLVYYLFLEKWSLNIEISDDVSLHIKFLLSSTILSAEKGLKQNPFFLLHFSSLIFKFIFVFDFQFLFLFLFLTSFFIFCFFFFFFILLASSWSGIPCRYLQTEFHSVDQWYHTLVLKGVADLVCQQHVGPQPLLVVGCQMILINLR